MSLATATFNEILDDLSCRFIINIPAEESLTVERLGFQIEEAHWFYEDFIRELNPSLPNFTLKNFSNKLFTHCPLLKKWSSGHDQHYGNFLDYKLTVPVCGAIVLNRELNECVCVKGYSNRSTWGFPRGKIDSNEEDYVCAIRELKEEIGFDLTPYIQPEQYIQIYVRKQRIKLFIIPCIPKHLEFKPKTRKEISRIQWFPLSYFPNFTTKNVPQDAPIQSELKLEGHGRFYLINPFMNQLAKWIEKYKHTPQYKLDIQRSYTVKLNLEEEEGVKKASNLKNYKGEEKRFDNQILTTLEANYKVAEMNDFQFDTKLIMANLDSILFS